MDEKKSRSEYMSQYRRNNYKTIHLCMPKDFFESQFVPAVEASGETMSGYIKEAIRMYLNEEGFEK